MTESKRFFSFYLAWGQLVALVSQGKESRWKAVQQGILRTIYWGVEVPWNCCVYQRAVVLKQYLDHIQTLWFLNSKILPSPSSVQFSHSVVSDSLRPHELQHARPLWPSPTPGVHPDSCPWSQWWHPAISSSVVPFSFCPQSLPASESFPMSQLFAWGGQSTGVSASASLPPKKSKGWSPSEWTGWIIYIYI